MEGSAAFIPGTCSFVFFLLITKKPSHLQIATIADAIYSVWAKYRLQVTGKYSMHLPLSVIFGYNDLCFHFLIH